MEPITYFITFGTAIMGLIFFRYHKIEYSYPALAALITRRTAQKLYRKCNFDIEKYAGLQSHCLGLERQLMVLQPPQCMLSTEQAQILGSDLDQLKKIHKLRDTELTNKLKVRRDNNDSSTVVA